jgi:dihydrolipoamide dehydrogenase
MAERAFDVIIVGGGPGGYVAAIRAAQLGMRTAVVERKHLGGICLNWGCIPTKALLRSSEINHLLHHLEPHGFSVGAVSFDFAKIIQRSRDVAQRLNNGVKYLLKKNQVTVVDGQGRLGEAGRITIDGQPGQDLVAKHVILATGARAKSLPGLQPDGERIWTYMEALVPTALPTSLVVIGAGAIGVEFASFYRDLGVEVTLVEIAERVLPAEDDEISAFARRAFEKQGMKIRTGMTVKGIVPQQDGVLVTLEGPNGPQDVTAKYALLAVGITGNVEELGLEGTRALVDRGHVVVNEWFETGEPCLYAVGDLVGPPWLAHKAMHEGIVCVEHIAGVATSPINAHAIPACVYSRPQIASVGLTERDARAQGHEVRVGRFPYAGNGKAVALGDTEGLVKTVFDATTGALLGAHMIGAEVTELIQGFMIALTLNATEAQLLHTIFPHPTLSETMGESMLAAFGRVIHV